MSARGVQRLWTAAFRDLQEDKLDLASGDKLVFKPEVDDQGSVEVGDGTFDMDVKVFLGSPTEFVLFDVGNSVLSLKGVKVEMTDGGTVTQTTSKSTGVTLNTHSGQITTDTAALAAGAEVAFTVTNSVVVATDIIIVNVASGQTNSEEHLVWVGAVAAGSFDICIANLSAASHSDALVINFAVLGGSSS